MFAEARRGGTPRSIRASVIRSLLVLVSILAAGGAARAQSTTTPPDAFVRQIAAQFAGVKDHMDLGVWDASDGRVTNLVFSKGGVDYACREVVFDTDATTVEDVEPTCVVWDIHNLSGQVTKRLFVGWGTDGQCDATGNCTHQGGLSGTPLASLMYIGTWNPGDTATVAVYSLAHAPDWYLNGTPPGSPLDWTYSVPQADGTTAHPSCWQFLFSALAVQDPAPPPDAEAKFDVMADVTAIEYGYIAAGISVAIIAEVQKLGTDVKASFTKVSTSLSQ